MAALLEFISGDVKQPALKQTELLHLCSGAEPIPKAEDIQSHIGMLLIRVFNF